MNPFTGKGGKKKNFEKLKEKTKESC